MFAIVTYDRRCPAIGQLQGTLIAAECSWQKVQQHNGRHLIGRYGRQMLQQGSGIVVRDVVGNVDLDVAYADRLHERRMCGHIQSADATLRRTE